MGQASATFSDWPVVQGIWIGPGGARVWGRKNPMFRLEYLNILTFAEKPSKLSLVNFCRIFATRILSVGILFLATVLAF